MFRLYLQIKNYLYNGLESASTASEVMFEVINSTKLTMPDNFVTMQVCSKLPLNASILILSPQQQQQQQQQEEEEEDQGYE